MPGRTHEAEAQGFGTKRLTRPSSKRNVWRTGGGVKRGAETAKRIVRNGERIVCREGPPSLNNGPRKETANVEIVQVRGTSR